MAFNLQKFLIENRLTKRSRLNEDAMTKTDAEQQTMGAEQGDDVTGDEEMFDYGGDSGDQDDDIGSSDEFEREPAGGDIESNEPAMNKLAQDQAKLSKLEKIKDTLVSGLNKKKGQEGYLSLDQYKTLIQSYEVDGKDLNIPQEIKKLRASIAKQTDPVIGDTEEEDI